MPYKYGEEKLLQTAQNFMDNSNGVYASEFFKSYKLIVLNLFSPQASN